MRKINNIIMIFKEKIKRHLTKKSKTNEHTTNNLTSSHQNMWPH